jgi:hypothetical protein
MHRFLLGVALLGVLAVALTWSTSVSGQSMSKNLTGTPVTIEGMKSATSSQWKTAKAEKPELAKFTWPKAAAEKEDGVLVVLPNLEGEDKDNLEAWKALFKPAKGDKFADDDIKVIGPKKVGAANITLLEVNGTYLDKKGASTEEKPKYRMYATIFEVNGKKYFIRAVGPVNTMKRNGSDFKAWLAAFK